MSLIRQSNPMHISINDAKKMLFTIGYDTKLSYTECIPIEGGIQMLYRKQRKRYSKKTLQNDMRRIRKIKIMCVHMLGIVILVSAIGIITVVIKNNGSALIMDEANSYSEIYVIKASTEEKMIDDTLSVKSAETLLGREISPDDILVNKQHRLPENYEVSLHMLKNGQQVASLMYDDLRDMLFTGEEEEDVSFIVCSGYRNEEKQHQLLQEEIDKNMELGMTYELAKEDALLTVAPAGYSEHETGLAVDIVAESNQRLDDTQEYTRENKWLQENCYKYGFILRYPKGKEDITGFSYESWHFRYVGKEVAKEIMEQGITLEEYLE